MTGHVVQLRRDKKGQSLVEFALASVLFFTVMFGIIQFGLAIWRYNSLSNLAQDGARWASVRGNTSGTPATAADLQTYVQSRAPGFSVTVTATPGNPSAQSPGGLIAVRVQSTFTVGVALLPISTLNLESTARTVVTR